MRNKIQQRENTARNNQHDAKIWWKRNATMNDSKIREERRKKGEKEKMEKEIESTA